MLLKIISVTVAALSFVFVASVGAKEPRVSASRKEIVPSGIPLRQEASGHLVLDVTVNGRLVTFLLDTGAPKSAVDRGRSLDLNIPPGIQGLRARSFGGVGVPTELSHIQEFRVGRFRLKEEPVILMDLSMFSVGRSQGHQICGIIGADFLTRHRATIDYGRLLFTLEE